MNVFKEAAEQIRKGGKSRKLQPQDYWAIGDVCEKLITVTKTESGPLMAETEVLTRLALELGGGFSKSTLQYCVLFRRHFTSAQKFLGTFGGLKWSYIVDLAPVADKPEVVKVIVALARERARSTGKDFRGEIRKALTERIAAGTQSKIALLAAEKLKAYRLEEGITQQDLSAKAKVGKKDISDFERHVFTPPKDVVARLFKATRVKELKKLLPKDNTKAS